MKSGIAMVRISGTKIRALREEQNLTQLYLATVVEVTTETISRWERKDSPTIKEENALKLAEALAVSLETILAVDDQEETENEQLLEKIRTIRRPVVIAAILVASLSVFFFIYLFFSGSSVARFSAKRLLPDHGTTGHPFPVVIRVDSLSHESSSLLLKEQLPSGCRVLQTTPVAVVASDGFIKWIDKKASGKRDFAYLASCEATETVRETFFFEGTLFVRQSRRQENPVSGNDRFRLSVFHWADTNRDNSIDDEELLAVYDDFASAEGMLEEMDEIESIWMGSAYRWDSQRAVFEIIP